MLLILVANNAYLIPIDAIVAVVNDEVILSSDLDEKMTIIKQQLTAKGTIPPRERILRRQVLERLISDRLQIQLSKRQGIRISDQRLNDTIQNIARQNNMALKEFKDALEKDGFDFSNFRENIRSEMMMTRLRQRRVGDLITITEQEVDNFLSTQAVQGNIQDEYRLAQILIAIPEGASPAQISATKLKTEKILKRLNSGENFSQLAVAESNGQNALESGDLGWRKGGELPTPFVPAATSMKIGEISELIRTSSGFHIIKLVDKKGGPKHMVTQRRARHILLRPTEIMSKREVFRRLNEIKQRIENGDDFSALAKAHSQDKISANNGGDLGWINPGATAPQFERVMKKLKLKQVSEPFASRYGWHIVQLLDIRNRDNTVEFKRSKARELIRERKFSEELQTWLRKLRDEAYVDIRLEKYIPEL